VSADALAAPRSAILRAPPWDAHCDLGLLGFFAIVYLLPLVVMVMTSLKLWTK